MKLVKTCPAPTEFHQGTPVGLGCRGLQQLQRRTKRNAWFAIASSFGHGGQVGYEEGQARADFLTDTGAASLSTREGAAQALRKAPGSSASRQDVATDAVKLANAARCYLAFCGPGTGRTCMTKPRASLGLMRCLSDARATMYSSETIAQARATKGPAAAERLQADNAWYSKRLQKADLIGVKSARGTTYPTGIGPKTQDMAREYFGDPSAVAVDRHVLNTACRQGAPGTCSAEKQDIDKALIEKFRLVVLKEAKAAGTPVSGTNSYRLARERVRAQSFVMPLTVSQAGRRTSTRNLSCNTVASLLPRDQRPRSVEAAGLGRFTTSDLRRTALCVDYDGDGHFTKLALQKSLTAPAAGVAWKKGFEISNDKYKAGQKALRRWAKDAGVDPASYQVGAWLRGMCEIRAQKASLGGRPSVSLMKGAKPFDCCKALPPEDRKHMKGCRRTAKPSRSRKAA